MMNQPSGGIYNQPPDQHQQYPPTAPPFYQQRKNISEILTSDSMIVLFIIGGIFLAWLGYLLGVVGRGVNNGTGIIEGGMIVFSLGITLIIIMLLLLGILRLIFPAWNKHEGDRWVRVFTILAGVSIIIIGIELLMIFGAIFSVSSFLP
ncbi:MAG: hypothetical protein ACP5F1_00390 [Thermoplasmata archaeon]|nr:hypothetical protein [Thermoplasmata archaeon]